MRTSHYEVRVSGNSATITGPGVMHKRIYRGVDLADLPDVGLAHLLDQAHDAGLAETAKLRERIGHKESAIRTLLANSEAVDAALSKAGYRQKLAAGMSQAEAVEEMGRERDEIRGCLTSSQATEDMLAGKCGETVELLIRAGVGNPGDEMSACVRVLIAERDAASAELKRLRTSFLSRDRLQTIMDEEFGPYPEEGADWLLDELERRLCERRARILKALAERDAAVKERDEMRALLSRKESAIADWKLEEQEWKKTEADLVQQLEHAREESGPIEPLVEQVDVLNLACEAYRAELTKLRAVVEAARRLHAALDHSDGIVHQTQSDLWSALAALDPEPLTAGDDLPPEPIEVKAWYVRPSTATVEATPDSKSLAAVVDAIQAADWGGALQDGYSPGEVVEMMAQDGGGPNILKRLDALEADVREMRAGR